MHTLAVVVMSPKKKRFFAIGGEAGRCVTDTLMVVNPTSRRKGGP